MDTKLRKWTPGTIHRVAVERSWSIGTFWGRVVDVALGMTAGAAADYWRLDNFGAVLLVGVIGLGVLPGLEYVWRRIRAPYYILLDENAGQDATIASLQQQVADIKAYYGEPGVLVEYESLTRDYSVEPHRRTGKLRGVNLHLHGLLLTNQTDFPMSIRVRGEWRVHDLVATSENAVHFHLDARHTGSPPSDVHPMFYLARSEVERLGGPWSTIIAAKRIEIVDLVRGVEVGGIPFVEQDHPNTKAIIDKERAAHEEHEDG